MPLPMPIPIPLPTAHASFTMLSLNNDSLALLLALGATLSFASASMIFAEYSKRISVIWMNCFKAVAAFAALAVTVPFLTGWHHAETRSIVGLLVSGWIGLNLGDLFLLSAFTRIGAARTLILFGFQPLMVGLGAYFLFGQKIPPERLIAVVFLIACLFTFSLEKYRQNKNWEIKGLLYALIGVALDTCGILITRASFGTSPEISPLEGHFYRCAGAIVGFAVLSFFRPFSFRKNFQEQPPQTKLILIGASLAGTYLSLALYLSAIKIGQLASIASIAITGPIFATILEHVIHRKAPSRYLLAAFVFFGVGFYILLRTA